MLTDAGCGAFGNSELLALARGLQGGAEHPAGLKSCVAEILKGKLAGASLMQRRKDGEQIDGKDGQGRADLPCHVSLRAHGFVVSAFGVGLKGGVVAA